MKTITSDTYELIKQDLKKVLYNAAVFSLPALAICLEQLINGKQFADVLPILSLWFLNTLLDLTRKWMQKTQYAV